MTLAGSPRLPYPHFALTYLPRVMFDNLFFVLLVLNATGLFRFVALVSADVDISQLTMLLWLFNVAYVIARAQYLAPYLRALSPWFLLLVLWPLATVFYAPALELREVGLAFYYFLLFTGTVLYGAANGWGAVHRVLGVSLAISLFGLILSMIAPEYFRGAATLAGAPNRLWGTPLRVLPSAQ